MSPARKRTRQPTLLYFFTQQSPTLPSLWFLCAYLNSSVPSACSVVKSLFILGGMDEARSPEPNRNRDLRQCRRGPSHCPLRRRQAPRRLREHLERTGRVDLSLERPRRKWARSDHA